MLLPFYLPSSANDPPLAESTVRYKFLLANVIGSTLWVLFWAVISYQVGHQLDLIPWISRHVALLVAVISLVLLAAIGFLFIRARRQSVL